MGWGVKSLWRANSVHPMCGCPVEQVSAHQECVVKIVNWIDEFGRECTSVQKKVARRQEGHVSDQYMGGASLTKGVELMTCVGQEKVSGWHVIFDTPE